jgi:hypothetical protein
MVNFRCIPSRSTFSPRWLGSINCGCFYPLPPTVSELSAILAAPRGDFQYNLIHFTTERKQDAGNRLS